MNDQELKRNLQDALQSMQSHDAPGFDVLWAKTEERYQASRSRYRRIAGIATAAAVAAIAFTLWPIKGSDVNGNYLTEEDLMSSTQWVAPSDVLLPKHEIDIYSDLPVLIETNGLDEGSLL